MRISALTSVAAVFAALAALADDGYKYIVSDSSIAVEPSASRSEGVSLVTGNPGAASAAEEFDSRRFSFLASGGTAVDSTDFPIGTCIIVR